MFTKKKNKSSSLKNQFSLILEIFLSITLGSLTILPVIIIFCILNQIFRFFVSILLRTFYKDQIILNPTGYDGMYMYKGYKHGKRMVLYLSIQEDPIDLQIHHLNYEKHLINQQPFAKLKKIWMTKFGYHCLKEDSQFNIKNHVRIYPNLNPEKPLTEEQLMSKILPELSFDMDESKPQWEEVIIPYFVPNFKDSSISGTSGSGSGGKIKSVRIFRIHHGYMDGLSTLLMFAHSQSTGNKFPWVIDPLRNNPKKQSFLSKFFYYSFCAISFSSTCFKNLLNPPKYIKNNWSFSEDKYTGETVHSWSNRIDMKILKEIRTKTGVSMPAILCSVLATSLRDFELKKLSAKSGSGRRISEEVIIGLVGAFLPYPDLTLRNNHSIFKCYLNTKEMSRIERLGEVNEEIKRLGQSSEGYLNFLMPRLFGEGPAWLSNFFTSLMGGSGCVSNVPVTSEKIKFWDNQVEEIAGWVPLVFPTGFACATIRYADSLRFCMNADKASLSKEQLDSILSTIEKEIHFLAKDCLLPHQNQHKSSSSSQACSKNKENLHPDIANNNKAEDDKEKEMIDSTNKQRLQEALNKIRITANKLKNS